MAVAEGLAARGQRLWDALEAAVEGERGLVLLEEACRTADRLDRLNALLSGHADSWCQLVLDVRGGEYELRIDSALTEARQQANVLRQLLGSLPLKGPHDPDGGDGWLDDL